MIVPSDELYHWKKKDAKYITREWKNGRWQYTYADAAKDTKKNPTARAAYNTWQKQANSAKVKNITVVEGKNAPSPSYQQWNEFKRRADMKDKAIYANPSNYDTAENRAKQKTSDVTKAVKKAADMVESWFKDKLGYDEKENARNAEIKAKVKQYEYEDTKKKDEAWKAKHPDNKNIEYLADWQINYYREMADEAVQKSVEAVKAYEKTPLAKLEKAKKTIDSAKEWVDGLVSERNLNANAKATERKPMPMKELNQYEQKINTLQENLATAAAKGNTKEVARIEGEIDEVISEMKRRRG
jgi:hypothetical protein